ncbi:BnaA04g05460D [Brassica napus]|uniref:BnaA04g05460D protein n=1 Tax=Brassica napus TaxID=3708 RepID=A0A078GF13_BRANA|nr:BnaA04g05460D [Brassica napus]
MRFVTNATDLASEDYYDYIIVGGGTAGCPLAATLSQSFRVLLLERGGFPFDSPAQSFQCDQRWVLQQS